MEFFETTGGKFKIWWLPPAGMRNKSRIIRGEEAPMFDDLGAFGCDPYKNDKVKYGRGSKGAFIGYFGDHPYDDVPKNRFFLLYLYRPQTKDIFFEDVIMAMRYYGMMALIENNIPELLYLMHRRGLSKYSMRRPDKSKLSADEMKYGGVPGTDPKLARVQSQYLEKHIEDHIGVASSDEFREIGEYGDCPFNELLSDWLMFDVGNRTAYDATVASCLAVYGAQKYMIKNMINGNKRDRSNAVMNFYNRQYKAI